MRLVLKNKSGKAGQLLFAKAANFLSGAVRTHMFIKSSLDGFLREFHNSDYS